MSSCSRWFPLEWLLCLSLVIAALPGYAEHPDSLRPASPPKLVNDFAQALWPGDAQYLENKLVRYDKETSNQIAIITVHTLDDYEIADYALHVANRWGIGNKDRNNGILVLVSTNDRQVHIAVGRGLEPVITDAICNRIIRNEMLPAFKEDKIYDGLSKGTDALILAANGEYKASRDYYKAIQGMPRWLIIILLIVGINGSLLGLFSLYNYLRYKITGKRYKPRESGYPAPAVADAAEASQDDNSSSSGSSNEQFGGYHGGSFGGGGASGKW